MTLKLTIENVASLTSGDPVEMVLNEHGLVIGRAAHADWTLPDPRNHISSLHAEIDFTDGRYVLTDRSTNGVFINGGARLTAPHVLRDGDLVTIGQYEIRAAVSGAAATAASASAAAAGNPFGGGLDWSVASSGGAKAADASRFGREPPKPLFQSGGDPLMNAFAPPAAAFAPRSSPVAAPDPFGLAAPAPGTVAAAPPAAADPFGTRAPANPFGAAPAAPDPFGTAAPAPAANPFGTAPAPPPPSANPFGTADPFGTAPAAPPPGNPFGGTVAPDPFGAAAASPGATAPPPAADPWAQLHKFDTLDFAATAAPPPAAPPPSPKAAPSPANAAAPAPPAAVSPGSDALFARLLAAAGLKPSDLGDTPPASVVEAAGRLLRQTADGLIRLLDARARIRHQFGVGAQVTTFQRAGNNPLKWTRSPEQALKQLIGTPDPGFLAGPMAVQGAFEDLQAHEVAMIAAMQEALGATVERFSPDAIKARVQAKAGLLPGSREAALWRAFEGEYKALAHESEAAYLDLFAKNFRKAYERNIKKADPA
ncbi:MAG: type VI secretion system-associated FHA domain protein TagH [Sphingomonadaceae bacterium]|nr:type VI secretion system-associated FHA domain protein TagH [Sphingomonadaceae bacterium]